MKRFSIRNLFLVSVLILSLLSGCVIKTSQVTINFNSERLSEAEYAYIRYSNGDVVQAPNLLPNQNDVTVATNSTQSIVGGYVSDGVVSWVPNMSYGGGGYVTVSGISASKPKLPVGYVKLNNSPVVVQSQPEYISVTFAVYDTDGKPVDDRTEIFAYSADTALTFYNIDPSDQNNGNFYTRTNTVDEGYSWYTVNGLVTFQIKSGISEIYNAPLSLYSGSQFITNDPFHKKSTPVAAINVGSAGDASSLLIGDTLAMHADILPVDASYKKVKWSVENGTGSATISTSGVLAGISAGTVTVKATAIDGNTVYGTTTIKIHGPVIPVQKISVTAEDEVSTIESGKTLQMYAVVAPSDATYREVAWSVIDGTGTAVIDEETGELTAGNPGTVTVQATATDESEVVGSTIVTITAAQVPVSSITLTGDSSVLVGQTLTVDATVAPANATDKSIEWSVENGTGTATISKSGVLTGVSAGTVTVKATAADGSAVFGTKTIEINEPAIPVQVISVTADGEVTTIESGKKLQMNAVAAPSNATNKAVAWSVIDGTGTAVIDKTTGELTAGNPGTVTVQATAADESGVVGSTILTITAVQVPVASITLTGDSSVLVGQTLTVDATVAPANATEKSIEWSVENGTGIATISKSGVLTGVSAGTVTVKATAADGSAVFGTKTIEINEPAIPVQVISVTADGEVTTIESGKKLQMNAVAAPSNATNKAVAWSVIDGTGTAVIDKTTGELTAGNPGTVTVQATAADESGVVGSTILTITAVQVPVASITLTGDSSVLVGQTLTVDATVAPTNATDKSIEWSVENATGTATISKSGVLTGVSAGTVTVKATAADGSTVFGTKIVEVKVSSGSGGDHGNPTPTPAPTTKPEKTPEPKPTATPEVKFDQNVIQVEKVISSLNKKVEEAKANPTDVEFKDTKSHWAGATVHIFVKLGIVNGYEDGSFQPNASITRAEFATIIAKVFDLSAMGDKNKLSDVSDHWASASIAALTESGIISGYEDGTFKPNKEISRAEIISIISKIIDLKAVNTASVPAFTDIDGAWNKEQIKQAAAAGIINGAGNGQFAPNKPSSRAEALTIILHTLQTNADLKAILEALK